VWGCRLKGFGETQGLAVHAVTAKLSLMLTQDLT